MGTEIAEMLGWWNFKVEREIRMKELTLIRVAYTEFGTFGVLKDENIPFCVTLEREWKDNKVGESCIPTGDYVCKRVKSPKFGDTFEITNVSNRTSILFHSGNIDDDSHGCVLVGEMFEPIGSESGILNPVQALGHAFKEFLSRLSKVNEFFLTIKNGE